MILHSILSALTSLPLLLSAPLTTQSPLLDTYSPLLPSTHRPTRYESTILGRRLLALSSTGVISTIFPPSSDKPHDGWTPAPDSVSSLPIALPDYLADCESPKEGGGGAAAAGGGGRGGGNPTLLLLDPSTSSRNTRFPPTPHHPTNISLSLSWWDSYTILSGRTPFAPADLPRLSMIGYLEEISISEAEAKGIVECYVGVHPDAKWWLPGDEGAAHEGRWARMVVQEVYWMGGFGDRHFIGWFDTEEWRRVGRAEWERVRLPGEEE